MPLVVGEKNMVVGGDVKRSIPGNLARLADCAIPVPHPKGSRGIRSAEAMIYVLR